MAGVSAAAAFLKEALRLTWPSAGAVLCAVGVDAMRPRGSCGTHSLLLFPALGAALVLAVVGAVTAIRGLLHSRRPASLLAAGISSYAIALTWLLATV